MEKKNLLLEEKTEEFITLTKERAENERNYSKELAKEMLQLKLDGQSITLIKDLTKGNPMVADLKFKLDVSEGVMRACSKSIANISLAIESYRSILTWKRAEFEKS